MSDEGRLFLKACGASGPLRFEWTDPTTTEPKSRIIEQPAFVIGQDPAADLVLDDSTVAPYHAFLHVVDGRLFAFDLGTANGLRWGEIPRGAGWVNRGQPIRIGRHTIRLVGGDRAGDKAIVQPAPTSSRYVSRLKLPGVVFEFRVASAPKDGPSHRDILDRVLILAGNSEVCKLRVEGRQAPKFICALIRTAAGLWMTNIFPTEGATVNGAFCRFALLEDDDVLELANSRIRIIYNDSAQTAVVPASGARAGASLPPAARTRALGNTAAPGESFGPEILPKPWLEQANSELPSQSSPFGQALIKMVSLLGEVHHDHLRLVRDELAEIRRLGQEMARPRTAVRQPAPRQIAATDLEAANGASREPGPEAPPEGSARPHPQAIPEMIGDRLEAWERERTSRWRKLLRLLIQT